MPLIKLDATDSTNDFLKQIYRESEIENYTIVLANYQTSGKGQFGAKWISDPGKNLIMSLLIKDVPLKNNNLFNLNVAVSAAILKVLKKNEIPNIAIKWPNDIMADTKKVAGILIENILKSDGTITSIIGIGINLNQTNFENLPNATSLHCLTSLVYKQEDIALNIKEALVLKLSNLSENAELLWAEYHKNLYKKDTLTNFTDSIGNHFTGTIKKVTKEGKLEILLASKKYKHFDVKQIKMS